MSTDQLNRAPLETDSFGMKQPFLIPWLVVGAVFLLYVVLQETLSGSFPNLIQAPEALVPITSWINEAWDFTIEAEILGVVTLKEITRGFADIVKYPMTFIQSILVPNFRIPRWLPDWMPTLPWLTVAVLCAIAGHYAAGMRMALLIIAGFLYFVLFGMWKSTSETIASIIFAVPASVLVGLWLGVLSFNNPGIRKPLRVLLDLMQTVPFFSYMVPILTLFGVNPVSALIATMIFSIPPMVRVTEKALGEVPNDLVDFGRISGCSPFQILVLVRISSVRESLIIGVNQVILFTLNLVILASMIGARGLGFNVWTSLSRLDIGKGLEFGTGIVILAVLLDRFTRALVVRRPVGKPVGASWFVRHRHLTAAGIGFVVTVVLATFLPALALWPKSLSVTTAPMWNDALTWVNINMFDYLSGFRDFVTLFIINPLLAAMRFIPWPLVVAAFALLGYQLGGRSLALPISVLLTIIAVLGLWDKAAMTVLECAIAVGFCTIVGLPLGFWCAWNDRVWSIVRVVADFLQTIPAFVFLIPFIMVFRTGTFTAILIVISFAIVPAIRYTAEGVRLVPKHLIEAGHAMGCSNWQIITQIQIPMAMPSIILGINQTIMMSLAMLAITAFTGSPDLGLDTLAGVTQRDLGRSLLAGLAICALAFIFDRLMHAAAEKVQRSSKVPSQG